VITDPSTVASFPAVMLVHSSGYGEGERGSTWDDKDKHRLRAIKNDSDLKSWGLEMVIV